MKECSKCKELKSENQFYINKRINDGFSYKCKICTKEYSKNRWGKKKEDIKEYRKKRTEEDKIYQQEYHIKNLERRRVYKKEYMQSDKGKLMNKVSGQNYRAKGLRLNNEITKEKVLSLFESQNKSCTYCNAELSLSERESYHIDHIQPLSRGGDNNDDNIQLLCPDCNRSKHDKTHEEYLEYLKLIK